MTPDHFDSVWGFLSATPLLGLTITLVAYSLALVIYDKTGSPPILHPVVTAIALIITVLWLSDMPYQDYFDGAQFVHFLLGPATVALAIPLYQQLPKLKAVWFPVSIALVGGALFGALSSIGIAWSLGASLETQLSLAPKSVTTPIAMGISEYIGGLPSLTAVLVVATGIIGSVLGSYLFRLFRIEDDSVKGIAMGVTAHGIGTARAFQISQQAGAFSGLAMGLSAVITALFLPWLVQLLQLY